MAEGKEKDDFLENFYNKTKNNSASELYRLSDRRL
jgi:hypothetical protein